MACAGPGRTAEPEGPPAPPEIVLEPGATTSAEERAARELVEEAGVALEEGRLEEARAAAASVVERHPSTRASGSAAWLLAHALSRLSMPVEAARAAGRYAAAVPPGDPRLVDARLFEAERLAEAGDAPAALDRLLRLPPELPAGLRSTVLERVRLVVPDVPGSELGRVLQGAALGQPLAAPAMVAYARTLLLSGEREQAARWARAAVAAGASGPDAEAARAILEDRAAFGGRPARIGVVLPLGGSPALRRFAEGVEEGVEAAVAAEEAGDAVELLVRDDGGDPGTAAELVRELEREGAVGVVGLIREATLAAAAEARRGALPLVSPSAGGVPSGERAVYSLGATDPGAVRTLAGYVARNGLDQVVVIHSTAGESEEEAALFEAALRELGGSVLRRIPYAPGTSYFRAQLETARNLMPRALLLAVPAEDVPALAPQVTFYGLDSLGIRVLGTHGWADEEVLREVSPRHTNGVVVATSTPPGREPPGRRRFVEAYERRFQRSVRDAVPALGYDAASILLLALRVGAREPGEVRRAIEEVRAFPGATGTLSVEEGRVVRRHYLVCLQDGRLVPMPEDRVSQPVERPVLRADDPDAPPDTSLRGMACPGHEPVGEGSQGAPGPRPAAVNGQGG